MCSAIFQLKPADISTSIKTHPAPPSAPSFFTNQLITAAKDTIYAYIMFKAADIEDLSVLQAAPVRDLSLLVYVRQLLVGHGCSSTRKSWSKLTSCHRAFFLVYDPSHPFPSVLQSVSDPSIVGFGEEIAAPPEPAAPAPNAPQIRQQTQAQQAPPQRSAWGTPAGECGRKHDITGNNRRFIFVFSFAHTVFVVTFFSAFPSIVSAAAPAGTSYAARAAAGAGYQQGPPGGAPAYGQQQQR